MNTTLKIAYACIFFVDAALKANLICWSMVLPLLYLNNVINHKLNYTQPQQVLMVVYEVQNIWQKKQL